MKGYSNITTFDELMDKEYGVKGTAKREKFEQECEAFKLGVLMCEARKELGLTKEELAEKCGTSKAIITRIDFAASLRACFYIKWKVLDYKAFTMETKQK